MPDRNNDRARLGEQSGRRNNESVESEEIVARPNQVENEEDLAAGDEGIEDASVMSGSERDGVERESIDREGIEREDRGASSTSDGSNRNPNTEDQSGFSGRGGQKGGSPPSEKEGTGYTNDRSGQLQEDDSLSGTQGRHGTTGNRQGSTQGRSGTSDSERVGGQTAQNPRGKNTGKNADVDRSKM